MIVKKKETARKKEEEACWHLKSVFGGAARDAVSKILPKNALSRRIQVHSPQTKSLLYLRDHYGYFDMLVVSIIRL